MTVTIQFASGRRSVLRPRAGLPWAFWSLAAVIGSFTSWGMYWAAWMIAGFLVPELYAVIWRVKLGPLSDNVWHWETLNFSHPFDFAIWTWQHWLLAILVWLLFGWLTLHLPFGQLR